MQYHQPYDQPLVPNAPYVNGNPSTGVPGSIPDAGAIEYPQREITNAIAQGGLTPADTDLNQLTRVIRGGQLDFDVTETGSADAMLVQVPLAHTQIKAGLPFAFVKGPNANSGNAVPTLTITDTSGNNGLTGTIVKASGGALAKGDLPAGALIAVRAISANTFALVSMTIASDVLALIASYLIGKTRIILTATLYVYVRPNGNDNNTGLINDDAHAFATIQGARNGVAGLYDTSFFGIVIVLGTPGTYAGAVFGPSQNTVTIDIAPSVAGGSPPPFSVVQTYVINCPAGQSRAILNSSASLTVQNVFIDFSYNGSAQPVEAHVWSTFGANTFLNNVVLNCGNNRANLTEMYCEGVVRTSGTIYSTGAGSRMAHHRVAGGKFIAASGSAVTYFISSGTMNYTGAFSMVGGEGTAGWYNGSFAPGGSTAFYATGSRYSVDRLGSIDVAGQGANFFPGNAAGTITNMTGYA